MQVPPPRSGSGKPEPHPAQDRGVRTRDGESGGPRPQRAPSAWDVAAQFVVDERTGRVLVRIYDTRTGETIRTIPPNEVVEFLLGTGRVDVRV